MITISILPELLEQADILAREEDRTRSAVFREALRCYIKQKEESETPAVQPRKSAQDTH